MLKKIFLPFLAIFFTTSNLLAQENLNYGNLAQKVTLSGLQKVNTELGLLAHATPPLNTKKLRKEIGNLKLLLDVFSFAYPADKKHDYLMEFRNLLDEGYEVVGNFKDLEDSGSTSGSLPSSDELVDLRSKAINWKKKIQEFINKEKISEYLSSPLIGKIQNRKDEDLHKYTWRQISFRPSSGISGTTIIRIMSSEVLGKAVAHLNTMNTFNDLLELSREEYFHSVRKEMRIVLKMGEMIPETFSDEINSSEEKKTIILAVEKFGSLHDLIMARHRAIKKKNSAKVTELTLRLNNEFGALKAWTNDNRLDAVLDQFARMLQ